MSFELTSPAFAHGEPIPSKYTCDGEDISPPLEWSGAPAGTQSFALIMDDPDAPVGTWIHWVLYNAPAETNALPEGVPADAELSDGSLHGKNSWRRTDYGGPCPPSGTHRYFFKLYALDTTLNLDAGATKKQLLQAMEGHILDQAELVGTYKRR
ncbi:MAG: YbhB/YbcL family Raf kinase inhibitor-like protein [Chloroflexi bacterium]|nr:MAG: YbhB/YbcL family Raf kinase inhibitor-like protein [Chloroflexota bacterium]